MLKERQPKTEIGIVIGRFQVHELTEGHKQLIDSVLSRHKKVAIFIGSTPTLMVTRNNPMDYFTRMLMIQAAYPSVITIPIKDCPSDQLWSNNVDSDIERIFEGVSDARNATLYGSRDGFIPFYKGKYQTVELEATIKVSGKEVRQMVSEEVRNTSEFRRGVIYAAYNKHDITFKTVDIACLKKDKGDVWGLHNTDLAVVRKKNDLEGKWRLPGGFVSKQDECEEDAALREFGEETGHMEVTNLKFLKSKRVDDWRYRKEVDGIMTSLFTCEYVFGKLEATDDVDQAKWMSLSEAACCKEYIEKHIIPEHVPLVLEVFNKLNNGQLTEKGAEK